MKLSLRTRHSNQEPDFRNGRLVLQAEKEWLLEGPESVVSQVLDAFPEHTESLTSKLVLLAFRGAVGRYTLPGVGEVELVSGKWKEHHFDHMLRELTDIAAALPFAHRIGSGLPFERTDAERPIPYHAFVYLRFILSDSVPEEERLDKAVERIFANPHRRLVPVERLTPLGSARAVGPRGLLRAMQTPWEWRQAASGLGGGVAAALGGYLPENLLEERRWHTVDTVENRFVLSALELAESIVEQTARDARSWRPGLQTQVLRECERVHRVLCRLRTHTMWREVGRLHHFPSASTVLQRQRGYREVLRHHIRLRLSSKIPLDTPAAKKLLEVKDLPTLYELWVFFAIVQAVERRLGRPVSADAPDRSKGQLIAPHGLAVRWADGTQLLYNARYARGTSRPSVSVPLRPDVSLFVASGPNRGLHLFDAKFRLESDAAPDGEDSDDTTFNRDDLYKMHTYRDAIPQARSVWIVYPGSEERFFSVRPDADGIFDGVGALPARPGEHEVDERLGAILGL